jgi:hypothetical protein
MVSSGAHPEGGRGSQIRFLEARQRLEQWLLVTAARHDQEKNYREQDHG